MGLMLGLGILSSEVSYTATNGCVYSDFVDDYTMCDTNFGYFV